MSLAALRPGSERRWVRGIATALVLAALPGGCDAEPGPRTDPELTEALGVPPGTPVHRIDLSGQEGRIRVLPTAVDANPGDLVQFVVADTRVYSVAFLLEEMSSGQRAFLRGSLQEASPPLVEQGARFVLSFADAPPGEYPFVVEGYGTPVRGRIRVLGGSGGGAGVAGGDASRLYSARPPTSLEIPRLRTFPWRVSRSFPATASGRR